MLQLAKPSPVYRLAMTALGLVVLGACNTSGTSRQHLVSPYPLDRARAAVHAAEAGDSDAVDLLVDLLEDHDRGVRMYAILALERLCDETYGYRYYDSDHKRDLAVARWRAARQRGEVRIRSDVRTADRGGGPAAAETATNGEKRP